jgi:hypothetical protein
MPVDRWGPNYIGVHAAILTLLRPALQCMVCTQAEGHVMYMGDALLAADYFDHLGFRMPFGTNLAGARACMKIALLLRGFAIPESNSSSCWHTVMLGTLVPVVQARVIELFYCVISQSVEL